MKRNLPKGGVHRIWLVTRLTTAFLIAIIMQVSASGFAQKITLTKSNASFKSVINELRIQSGYDFIATSKLLDKAKPVTISVKNKEFDQVLDQIFEDQPIGYSIEKNAVILMEKEKNFLKNSIDRLLAIDISGKVVDAETGNPLQGATVSIKGEKQSAKTRADGLFFLQNVGEDAVLVISYMGYKVREVPAKKEVGTIRLESTSGELEEVSVTVNTGYQRILPQQVTGAVSQIKTKAFESRISTDFLAGLQNRLPGLLINNDLQFQGNNLFQIRGISTMTGNPKPLIVLDGYPTDLSLNDINPNEIETVTILKDAAAAAIYGARASNGVIIIERKKGVAGDAQFAFRSTVGIRPHEDYSRYRYEKDGSIQLNYSMNQLKSLAVRPEFGNYLSGELTGDSRTLTLLFRGPDAAMNMFMDKSLGLISQQQMEASIAQLAAYNNADDYERYFLRDAVTNQYNLNVSGGTPKALYYLTGNYLGNRLNQQKNDNHKLQLSARLNLSLNKRLSMELLTDYNENNSKAAPIPEIKNIFASERFVDDNGNPLAIQAGYIGSRFMAANLPRGFLDQRMYPLREMNEVNTRDRRADYRIMANFRYNITKGLEFSLGGIYESSQMQKRQIATENSSLTRHMINRYVQLPEGTTPLSYGVPRGDYLQQEQSLLRSYTTRAQLTYNKQLTADHSLNAIIGAEARKGVTQGSKSAALGYNDQSLQQQPVDYYRLFNAARPFNFRFASNDVPLYNELFAQSENDDRFISGYMNAVYAYKSRYSLTGSIRIDQSNLFGSDPKYRYKPLWSLGLAWNIDRENFMQKVTWMNVLKLRIARGFNGNVSKASLPQVIASFGQNDVMPTSTQMLLLSSPANSGLRWEQTDNFNLGLDYTLFKNISGSIDYYNKRSTDVLGNIDTDPLKGVTSALVNQASINNQGLEFNLNADWIRHRKLNWNTGLVVSYNQSKVLEAYVPKPGSLALGEPETIVSSQAVITAAANGYMKGEPVGIVYSYRYAGIDAAGNALYFNSKGNKVTLLSASRTDEGFASLDSRGTSIPATNLGLSNRVDIGNFYLFCMINYYGGFVVKRPVPSPADIRPIEGAGDYWKQAGDESKVKLPSANYQLGSTHLVNSDRFILNGAYLTIGDITASYNLKNMAVLKKAGFSNFEIKAQVSNLYTMGFNRDNYSVATGSYLKSYLTPTYTLGLFTNF